MEHGAVMQRKAKPKVDREERRENALRPCAYLGYNWDDLGLHFHARGAEGLAESQFRHAVWLNPFEPEFKVHLAECLYHGKRYEEATKWVDEVLEQKPDHEGAKNLKRWIAERAAIEARLGQDDLSSAR
jgi:thioredoxin-like negative regulator of GroEL